MLGQIDGGAGFTLAVAVAGKRERDARRREERRLGPSTTPSAEAMP